tara:strand:+ start:946 stop:1209 length:264 start_codon:yes stop_codon:yes gene_type:complete
MSLPPKTQRLCDIVNSLSNDDLLYILNACSDRLCVYAGSYRNNAISFEGIEACSNGCGIKIFPIDKGHKDTFDLEEMIDNIQRKDNK